MIKFSWDEPDTEGLVQFMVREKGFNEQRILNGIEKLKKNLKAKPQTRLDGFFKPKASNPKRPVI